MNKDKINSKIEDLEAELQKLKKLANEPEQRTPEAGDVWRRNDWTYLIEEDLHGITVCDGARTSTVFQRYSADIYTYLGKHSEVYVKISDVRDALSHKDGDGDNVVGLLNSIEVNVWGVYSTIEALRKLKIITD